MTARRTAHNLRDAHRSRYAVGYPYATEIGPGTESNRRIEAASRGWRTDDDNPVKQAATEARREDQRVSDGHRRLHDNGMEVTRDDWKD